MDSALLLGHSANWWDAAMLLSLGGAAFVAVIVLGATSGSVVANKREAAAARNELKRYKLESAERAHQLEKDTAEARLKTEEVKSLVLWRSLSNEDGKTLVSLLVPGNGSITLAYIQNDPEAVGFAVVLSRILEAANKFKGASPWVIGTQPRMYSDSVIVGVSIFGKDGPALTAVKHAFSAAHIAFSEKRVAPPTTQIGTITIPAIEPTTDVVIMVGSKKPPF